MPENILEWLVTGPAWIRSAVETEILHKKPDIKSVINDIQIIEIINRLKDARKGIPNIGAGYWDSDEYLNPYWDLYFLSDLGLRADELGLGEYIDGFLAKQSGDGCFITEPSMKPRYFCKSAIVLSSISRMGYQDDPRLKKYIQFILATQRLDGGWYCNPDHDVGNSLQYEYSCPQDNLNVLRLLGQYPEFREDRRFEGAINLLLRHWEIRDTGIRIVYFGTGQRYRSLQYPATRYGILRILDTLSMFPYALKQKAFHEMLDYVRSKGKNGKYYAEIPTPYTDLEGRNNPSRMITFVIARIENRVEKFLKSS